MLGCAVPATSEDYLIQFAYRAQAAAAGSEPATVQLRVTTSFGDDPAGAAAKLAAMGGGGVPGAAVADGQPPPFCAGCACLLPFSLAAAEETKGASLAETVERVHPVPPQTNPTHHNKTHTHTHAHTTHAHSS